MVYFLIKSIYAFTNTGIPILNWNYDKNLKDFPAHEILVSGVISAIQSLVKDVFLTRLQRIELENGTIVITGKEFTSKDKNLKETKHILIISALVDKQDNSNLIDGLLVKILDKIGKKFNFSNKILLEEINLNEYLENLLNNKARNRSFFNVLLSFLLVFISINIAAFYYNFAFDDYINNLALQTIIQVGGGTLLGFILVIPSSFVAGKRTYGLVAGTSACLFASYFTDYIFRYVIDIDIFNKSVGTFAAYLLITIFIGMIGGYIGGYLAERIYLFPLDPVEDIYN